MFHIASRFMNSSVALVPRGGGGDSPIKRTRPMLVVNFENQSITHLYLERVTHNSIKY